MSAAQERFDELFRSHYGGVLAYAVRRCASRADAEDVVAETFAVAWRRIGELPAGAEARPWLFGTARLVLMNSRRTRRRQRWLRERLQGRMWWSTRRGADGEVTERDRLTRALAQLNPTDREVLQLRVWEQLDHDDIAEALEVEPATVRKRMQRARERLAAALDDDPDPAPAVPQPTVRSTWEATR